MRDLIFEAVETVEVQNGGLRAVELFRCGVPGAMEQDAGGCFVGTADECLRYLVAFKMKRQHAKAAVYNPRRLEYRSPHKYRVLRRCTRLA